jgi:hypothetical protein
MPEFFADLAAGAETLEDVRRILGGMGAADETERESPYVRKPGDAPAARIARALATAAISDYEDADGRVLQIRESTIGPAVRKALGGTPGEEG